MARELPDYRDNLESILAFSGGAQLLGVGQVKRYCFGEEKAQHVDNRRVKRMFPFKGSTISAATLARCMSSMST